MSDVEGEGPLGGSWEMWPETGPLAGSAGREWPEGPPFQQFPAVQVEGLQGPVNPAGLCLAAPSRMTGTTGPLLGVRFLLLVAVLGSAQLV